MRREKNVTNPPEPIVELSGIAKHFGGVHALIESLQHQVIAVAIDDQGGKQVGFAVNYTVGVALAGAVVVE